MTYNTLVIMSDEHSRKVLRAYGNGHAITPNLDELASRGTLFENAYCNSPICVPSRASLHTGLYPHEIRYWDNAMPYDGRVQSWGHVLQQHQRPVTSIGKLHFRDTQAATGFDEQILPLHVKDGIGDPSSLLRKNPPSRPGTRQMAKLAGKGETPYWAYDDAVATAAEQWLSTERDNGWTAFVSFVLPHFPLNAPKRFRDLFDAELLPLPKALHSYQPENSVMAGMRKLLDFNDHFPGDDVVREAIANYYALTTALDTNIGRVLRALDASGASENTIVIYTSDHGDNMGARGYWGKSTLWEESAGVPMIVAGPDIPAGRRNSTPVSLIDLYPTVLDVAGISSEASCSSEPERRGKSLCELSRFDIPERSVFAEYHAVGASSGTFMLRQGHHKLIESPDDRPILYDLDSDPEEMNNIASDPSSEELLSRLRDEMGRYVDTRSADAQAFEDQRSLVEKLGGDAAVRAITPIAFTDPNQAVNNP